MKRTTFLLYHYAYLIKTPMLYIEELPEKQTYKIKVEGDNIEKILEEIYLPERIKQELRSDIVNIVRGYQVLTEGMLYTTANNELCKSYFRDMLKRFCVVHGSTYKFEEDEII